MKHQEIDMSNKSYSTARRVINISGSKEIMNHAIEKVELAKAIGARVVRERDWILLNGGARGIRTIQEPTAIDYWAAIGAHDEAVRLGLKPEDYIITLHPQTTDHPLHNIGQVEITKRKTPALRRFDLVARADAIITLEGLAGLVTILELSIALDKVLIPIPCTGGTSEETWNTYEEELTEDLGINRSSSDYILLTRGLEATESLANLIIRLLRKQLSPLCYVAIPSHSSQAFQSIVLSTIQKFGLRSVNFNEVTSVSSSVIDSTIETIRNARLIIADITNANPDVTYQLGIAEALGKVIIPICECNIEGVQFPGRYPLDLRFRKIIPYSLSQLSTFAIELEHVIELSLSM